MSENLKPCPFCGSTNILHEEERDASRVRCMSCDIGTGWVPGPSERSMNRWNRRVHDN